MPKQQPLPILKPSFIAIPRLVPPLRLALPLDLEDGLDDDFIIRVRRAVRFLCVPFERLEFDARVVEGFDVGQVEGGEVGVNGVQRCGVGR